MATDSPATNRLKQFFLNPLFSGLLFLSSAVLYKVDGTDGSITPLMVLASYLSLALLLISIFSRCVRKDWWIAGNISLTLALLLSVEIGFYLLLGIPTREVKDFATEKPFGQSLESLVGFLPEPNVRIDPETGHQIWSDYDADYTVDNHYRRVTPNHQQQNQKHALFLGGSFTFGHGLEDDQTLPAIFQQVSEEYTAYNYGFNGFGTNNVLARVQNQNLADQIPEKQGVAFYIFIEDHMARTIGTMDRYAKWVHSSPYYYLDGKTVIRDKDFKQGRPVLSWIYEHIYQLAIIQYLQIDFPAVMRARHYELVGSMIKEIETTYHSHFPDGNFFVVFYPSPVHPPSEEVSQLKPRLTDRNISYIDLKGAIDYNQRYRLEDGSHPNSEAHRILIHKLLSHITAESESRNVSTAGY
ncbi:MAG: hypothetical protein D6B25_08185 [Desulfobulbaceae bacterium]|mgnify:CR=1 FL=1|nr:MAG: hypothetical protein D6B25_08185 [Desulfobulbaceae bacterium]